MDVPTDGRGINGYYLSSRTCDETCVTLLPIRIFSTQNAQDEIGDLSIRGRPLTRKTTSSAAAATCWLARPAMS